MLIGDPQVTIGFKRYIYMVEFGWIGGTPHLRKPPNFGCHKHLNNWPYFFKATSIDLNEYGEANDIIMVYPQVMGNAILRKRLRAYPEKAVLIYIYTEIEIAHIFILLCIYIHYIHWHIYTYRVYIVHTIYTYRVYIVCTIYIICIYACTIYVYIYLHIIHSIYIISI